LKEFRMNRKKFNSITDIPGITVGHYTDLDSITGCTVILCEEGATVGVNVSGSAPGTRETDLCKPGNLVEKAHAILLSGGSAFGLAAADGVMKYLEENNIGYDVGLTKVPIVPAAIIFDLSIGNFKIRPDKESGYQACLNAKTGIVKQGSVGAGTGAAVGKIMGIECSTKGGVGTGSLFTQDGLIVAALMVVNSFGDVINHENGKIMAGARKSKNSSKFINSTKFLCRYFSVQHFPHQEFKNTTVGVIVTNAILSKEETNKVAQMANDGLARSINPAHTMFDGDVIFTLALNQERANVNQVGSLSAEVTSIAIENAVKYAKSLGGIPAIST
jgi:L-aminopeptidase/D-esterase-like protein